MYDDHHDQPDPTPSDEARALARARLRVEVAERHLAALRWASARPDVAGLLARAELPSAERALARARAVLAALAPDEPPVTLGAGGQPSEPSDERGGEGPPSEPSDEPPVFRCCSPSCPGHRWPASLVRHPCPTSGGAQ